MPILYCAETGGFYLPGMGPAGLAVVEISTARHVELRAAQSTGQVIVPDAAGLPVAIDKVPTSDELEERERRWRDGRLRLVSGVRDRHRDELELGLATTLTSEQFAELLEYIQQLRDWPQSEQFPVAEHRPAPPAWYQSGE
ncbi:tail fiber assembly protein [Pseudomonas aeruginosa]|uniref:tail fiber assembly protein n=1 Tax=Pseudomonas aeruginosa TaxID=287 RepID=UPI0038915B1F